MNGFLYDFNSVFLRFRNRKFIWKFSYIMVLLVTLVKAEVCNVLSTKLSVFVHVLNWSPTFFILIHRWYFCLRYKDGNLKLQILQLDYTIRCVFNITQNLEWTDWSSSSHIMNTTVTDNVCSHNKVSQLTEQSSTLINVQACVKLPRPIGYLVTVKLHSGSRNIQNVRTLFGQTFYLPVICVCFFQ